MAGPSTLWGRHRRAVVVVVVVVVAAIALWATGRRDTLTPGVTPETAAPTDGESPPAGGAPAGDDAPTDDASSADGRDLTLGDGSADSDGTEGLDASDPNLAACIGTDRIGTGSGVPDGDPDAQIEAITAAVAADRGLPPDGSIDVELTTREDLAARAQALVEEERDPEEAALRSHLLAGLAVVPPGTDVDQLVLDALDIAVVGFYDDDSEELVVGVESIDALGAVVVAHEVQHAVADDVLGLPDREAIAVEEGSDAASAVTALVEGDASLASHRYSVGQLTRDELVAVSGEGLATQQALDEVPHLIVRELDFPYVEGLEFACELWLAGGWNAVDAAYDELPTTTAQVLFPDRYVLEEEPVDVPDVAAPPGWALLDRDTFGAASLLFLLEAPGDDRSAAVPDRLARVAAWAGGEVTLLARGDDDGLVLVLADRGEGVPMCDTVVAFAGAAYRGDPVETDHALRLDGQDRVVEVRCEGDLVTLVVAPTADDVELLGR